MSISTKHGKVENVAYNFSDAQVKVREATSNDPWGPSTALMSEIADLTHNPMAFTEIMSIVWKRLNDSGKNWRHVYKSLVLLDSLIKCGHEKVAQQCRENVFTIEKLKDFRHVEDSRDQGLNIRDKAHQITSLLLDDKRLKNERTQFILTRNKFKQNNPDPVGAESRRSNRHHISDSALDPEYEEARPSTATEEEMQLQIALALSRKECEKADEMRKSDDARLQMALEESQKEADRLATTKQGTVSSVQLTQSALDDLLSLGVGELVSGNSDQPSSSGAWNSMGMADPWGVPQSSTPASAHTNDGLFTSSNNDPWATSFDLLGGDLLSPTNSMTTSTTNSTNGTRKTPENFLGENKNLVNLDNSLGSNAPSTAGGNPSLTSSAPAANPFAAQQRKSPTLNEMRAALDESNEEESSLDSTENSISSTHRQDALQALLEFGVVERVSTIRLPQTSLKNNEETNFCRFAQHLCSEAETPLTRKYVVDEFINVHRTNTPDTTINNWFDDWADRIEKIPGLSTNALIKLVFILGTNVHPRLLGRFNSHGTTKTAAKTAKIRRLTGFCSKDFSFKIGVLSHDGLVELLDQNDTSIQQFHISGYVEDLNSLGLLRLQTECAVYTYNRNKKAKLSRAQKHVLFFFEEAVMFCIKRVNKRKTGLNSEPEIFEHKLCIPIISLGHEAASGTGAGRFEVWDEAKTDAYVIETIDPSARTKWIQRLGKSDTSQDTWLENRQRPKSWASTVSNESSCSSSTRESDSAESTLDTNGNTQTTRVNVPYSPTLDGHLDLTLQMDTTPLRAAPTKLASPSMFNPLASSIPRKDSDSLMNGELVRRLRGPMDGIPSTSGSVVQSSSRMDETPKMRKPKDRKPKDLC